MPPELPQSPDPQPQLTGPGDDPAEMAKPPLRVLFVGNSYTFVNDLPGMLRHLAAAGGNSKCFVGVMECPGGAMLSGHWESGAVVALLQQSNYDWMVLQEQSQIPSFARKQIEEKMHPYAAKLHAAAVQNKTLHTLLYQTWGREHGDLENLKDDTYEKMQERLIEGYRGLAELLRVPVAPVGVAWRKVVRTQPVLKLWDPDHSHPSSAGTYLAACVLYRMFFEKSPVGNAYHANLMSFEAQILQHAAEESVGEYLQVM